MSVQQALRSLLTDPLYLIAWGVLVAYPVDILLVHVGVEEGMTNPAKMGA